MTVASEAVSVAVGFSEEFDGVEAAAEAAQAARDGLGGDCDLAVVFSSGPHLSAAKPMLSEIHDRLEPDALIGCGAAGALAGSQEVEDGPAVAVWAANLPGAKVTTLKLSAERDDGGFRLMGVPPELAGDEDGAGDPASADEATIVICDPYSFPAEILLGHLDRVRPGMPVLGGLASAAFAGGAVLLCDGEVVTEGAVGVRLQGVEVLPCVSQGAVPVGPEMAITEAEGNVITGLSSQNALERLEQVINDLGPSERELASQGLLLGIAIEENRPDHDRGGFLVRPIVGAEHASGAIAIGEAVRVGQTARLHVRDAASADRDLREALELQSAALGEGGAAGALLFTCNGRGANMFDVPGHDAMALQDALGAPTAGFFCAGEIGPVGGRTFLHGFTATMAVFPAT